MKADVYPVRSYGVKIPERDARSMKPMQGELTLGERWITQTRTKPALELRRMSDVGSDNTMAVLFEPKLVSMAGQLLYFSGYEVLPTENGLRTLTIQEWRCFVSP